MIGARYDSWIFMNQISRSAITLLSIFLPLTIGVPAWADEVTTNYFSNTYHESRTKFLTAAKAAGGNLEHYRNPYLGAETEELYADVATFNLPEAKRILVLGSGTHGVEGFAGSGIQVGLLREGITKNLPEDVGLLFYHALNPYGFSYLRRFNEDNVDLNRNFVNHAKPYPPNEGYDTLARLIEPKALTRWQNLKTKLAIAWYRITKGKLWLQKAISQGQYNHPKGIFFGGNAETWSNRTLQKIIERHLFPASQVVLIDIHTGLGAYGAAEVIAEVRPETQAYERMQKWWGHRVKIPLEGESVSPPVMGSLKNGFTRLLPHTDITAVSLEFGTSPLPEALWALRAENYLHHHSDDEHLDALAIKTELKRVFYPDKNDWKQMVWGQGKEVVQQALDNIQ